jgi:hypothetical protein
MTRRRAGKPAMRSALFMLISKYRFNDVLQSGVNVLDPSRMAAQIVSCTGFIGVGLIRAATCYRSRVVRPQRAATRPRPVKPPLGRSSGGQRHLLITELPGARA